MVTPQRPTWTNLDDLQGDVTPRRPTQLCKQDSDTQTCKQACAHKRSSIHTRAHTYTYTNPYTSIRTSPTCVVVPTYIHTHARTLIAMSFRSVPCSASNRPEFDLTCCSHPLRGFLLYAHHDPRQNWPIVPATCVYPMSKVGTTVCRASMLHARGAAIPCPSARLTGVPRATQTKLEQTYCG